MSKATKAKAASAGRVVTADRIRIVQKGKDTVVEVDRWPNVAAEQTISSCNIRRPNFPAKDWSGASIVAGERLDDGGFDKGRLLCLWDRPPLQQVLWEVAFLTYSVPKGRLVVRHVEVARGIHSDVADEYKGYLLACLQAISVAKGTHEGRIFWETENAAQEQEAADFGFKRTGSIFTRISGRQRFWEREPPGED